MKKLYLFVGSVMVAAIAVTYYFFDPNKYSFFPECPFHRFTGLNCPGCGSQRALHCPLNGELLNAMHYNTLMVASVPFLMIHMGYKLASLIKKEDFRWALIYNPVTPKIILALVLVFFVARNLPVYPFIYLNI